MHRRRRIQVHPRHAQQLRQRRRPLRRQRRSHAFYVRYDKYKAIDERRAVKKEGDGRRRAFARTLPPDIRKDSDKVLRRMINHDQGRFQQQEWTLFRPSTCNRNRTHYSGKGRSACRSGQSV